MADTTLERYAALATRVHDLLREPEPESLAAPPAVHRLVATGVYRLALYVSAMPGAQSPSREELEELRLLGESVAREHPESA